MLKILIPLLLTGLIGTVACGGAPPEKTVNKDEIRRNADQADRDLDRESDKHKDE